MLFDAIIIGQGLAGSLLALELQQQGMSVCLFDDGHRHSASRVAAGLVNPVTGKRLVLSAQAGSLLHAAESVYQQLATRFGRQFYHRVDMLRLMRDREQLGYLQKRLSDAAYSAYLQGPFSDQPLYGMLQLAHGYARQQHTGYLEIAALLQHVRAYFAEQHRLHDSAVDYAAIQVDTDSVTVNGVKAAVCIFCEGHLAQHNPWFGRLPFQPAKGEILTLTAGRFSTDYILNRGNWLIPVGQQQFRAGSTTDWQFADEQPTDRGRERILQDLQDSFVQMPDFSVSDHVAGIRPATRDKMPFLGRHPDYPVLAIFNGFGARGSLTIPYYSRLFSRHLRYNQALPGSVDIRRCSDAFTD